MKRPTCTIRRLQAHDLPGLKSHLIRLDLDGRRARFGYAISDLSLDAYAERCLSKDVIIYGYIENGAVHGIGELHVTPPRPQPYQRRQDGEVALSVELPWRGRGIGVRLIEHLLAAARKQRVTRLSALCSSDNKAMLALARRHATQLDFADGMVRAGLSVGRSNGRSQSWKAVDWALPYALGIMARFNLTPERQPAWLRAACR